MLGIYSEIYYSHAIGSYATCFMLCRRNELEIEDINHVIVIERINFKCQGYAYVRNLCLYSYIVTRMTLYLYIMQYSHSIGTHVGCTPAMGLAPDPIAFLLNPHNNHSRLILFLNLVVPIFF